MEFVQLTSFVQGNFFFPTRIDEDLSLISATPRADQPDTVERIKAYGGYVVVDENYLRTFEFRRLISDLPKPKLALNGAGGLTATEMARVLA